tara:strand:+ start:378 stop:563 length:186 start_codon:yes stop_codon:yes gene_type:complete
MQPDEPVVAKPRRRFDHVGAPSTSTVTPSSSATLSSASCSRAVLARASFLFDHAESTLLRP